MMRSLAALAAATALCAISAPASAAAVAAQSAASDAAELVEARAIVQTIYPPAQRSEMVRTLVSTILKQMDQAMPVSKEFGDPGLQKILADFRARVPDILMPIVDKHMPAIIEAVATAYVHEFDLAELKQIRAFAQTPAGGHYFSRAMYVIGDPAVAAANQAYFKDLAAVAEAEKVKLAADVAAYVDAHPDVGKKIEESIIPATVDTKKPTKLSGKLKGRHGSKSRDVGRARSP